MTAFGDVIAMQVGVPVVAGNRKMYCMAINMEDNVPNGYN